MIRITCNACSKKFHIADQQAAGPAVCPSCGVKTVALEPIDEEAVLEPAHAEAEAGATIAPNPFLTPSPGPDLSGYGPRPSPPAQASVLPPPGAFAFDLSEPESDDDHHRHFPSYLEEELRGKNLFLIGAVIAAAFFAPIVGIPGQGFIVPELSGERGVFSGELSGLALVVTLLPLLGGVVVMALSRMASPPMRGVGVTLVGAALFGMFFGDAGAREAIGQSFSLTPSTVDLSVLLWMVGALGLIASTRIRWYRPIHKLAYLIGAIAGGCYITYLFLPVAGIRPISQALAAFRLDALMGSAVMANIVFMFVAAVICIINLPFASNSRAAGRTRLAFFLLLLAVMIPVFIAMIGMLSAPGIGGMMAMPFISAGAKYGIIFGGLVLLIPIGIADLLIGRAEPR